MKAEGKYTVVVVEDEKIARDHLCAIINTRIEGFFVVGTAEDGVIALEVIEKIQPDLVVTDIHMPVMNGVQLLSHIQERFPLVSSVVVSGYQDFDSVKGALTNGSLDYILKPLSPVKIVKAFSSVREKLDQSRKEHQKNLLFRLYKNEKIDEAELMRFFPNQRYYLGIERCNSIPGRFFRTFSIHTITFIKDLLIISGRDDLERLFLYPEKGEHSCCEFKHAVREERCKISKEPISATVPFQTHAWMEHPFPIQEFKESVKTLFTFLDSQVILEHSQQLEYSKEIPEQQPPIQEGELQQLKLFLQENRFEDFQNELSRLLAQWKENQQTQLWVEGSLQQILHLTLKLSKREHFEENYEFTLDEVFSEIATYSQLQQRIRPFFQKIFTEDFGTFPKIDSPEFFLKVREYISKHCSERITLPDLCTVFGISQTYMSKLFRKYSGKSCNEYVKTVRLEQAKLLIIKGPDLQVKDVASIVGFKDQFYFSRLFHHEVGLTPSRFIQECKQSKNKHDTTGHN
ncbi:MAG: response regulator [Sphaerochaeta sp.]|nr:response regulator [Sphaerochaeta sp.]